MAVITTSVGLCSAALALAGADGISSFEDSSREAAVCALYYELLLDAALEDYPWRFSIGQYQLARLVDTPLFGYQYAYQLPVGHLRIVGPNSILTTDYKIYQDKIYTDADSLQIDSQFRPEVVNMSAGFKLAFSIHLASILSVALKDDDAQSERLGRLAVEHWRRARSNDSQGQTNPAVPDFNFLLTTTRL